MYTIQKPSSALSPFVKHYWMLDTRVEKGPCYMHRIVPNGLSEWTFYLGEKPVMVGGSGHSLHNSQLTGQLNNFFDIKITGKLSVFSIYFTPHGLSIFLDMPITEFYNQVVPLGFLMKKKAERLEDELQASNSFSTRVHAVEKFLLQRVQEYKIKHEFKRIQHAINIINKEKGQVRVDLLASECCLGKRQFERTFSKLVGTSPKQFLRVVRFQNAIHGKSINPAISLTQLAHEKGYYDQSHMISDFISLSGLTPKQYFSDPGAFSDYFQA
jgi:AraC-like DNA-binding protein